MSNYLVPLAEKIYGDLYSLCMNKEQVTATTSYKTVRQLFLLVLDECTENAGFAFSGPFAKMDYLAKENHVPKTIYRSLNHFRAKIRTLKDFQDEELQRTLLYDVRLLAEFVACVCHKSVPNELLILLPNDFWVEPEHSERPIADSIRVVVNDWNEQVIFAKMADEWGEEVQIAYSFSTDAGDLSAIGPLLSRNTQLNIIRPTTKEGVLYPELIVYEPDFLVDISTVADAFEEFGLTPYSYLLKRLMPRKNSQAILLGNLAGQFLDEEVYNQSAASYKESAIRFFQNNSMNLVSCPDFDSQAFHREAAHQQKNIRYYTEKQLDNCRIFDPEKVLLEPSFFCEMLGMQGRMDLLTDDKKVLIEQKSGKWGFPYGGHQEKHYVQMLFYLAWLRYNQHISTEDVSCLLLYSKYPTEGHSVNDENGLIKEGPAPKLLFQALMLRNSIAHLEFLLSQGKINLLDKLTADSLNVNHVNGKLWNSYQRPEYDKILDAIHRASDLERNYFYCFFTFLEKEYHLAKSEFAEAWNLSVEEKIQSGMAYANLQLIDSSSSCENGDGIDTLSFHIQEESQNTLPNFRKGDVVVAYSYKVGSTPSICRDIVYRATIISIRKDVIQVRLRSPQRNKDVFKKHRKESWILEHDFLDSSYVSSFKDIFSFITMTNTSRKQLILNQRQPMIDKSISLCADYDSFNELVLKAKQAQDYFLVIGPPGTGKTSFALVNILKETLLDSAQHKTSVLLVSYTNRAVEEMCSKLVKENIDFIRIGHEHSCTESFDKSYLLKNKINNLKNVDEIKEYLQSVRVYVGTTSSIAATPALFSLKTFDLAIVDEASQILEPNIIGLLTANNGTAIRKFILIGDHKQLPAVVQQNSEQSGVNSSAWKSVGLTDCRNSFFERLLTLHSNNDELIYLLNHQGRMHPEVSDFVNRRYYGNMLTSVPLEHQLKPAFYEGLNLGKETNRLMTLLSQHRMLCFHVPAIYDDSSDMVNECEAKLIVRLVYETWKLHRLSKKTFNAYRSVGVIVPYRSQIAKVKQELESLKIEELNEITVDTVERYQGSERDVIIYGTTVKKIYQLDFLSANILQENGMQIDRKLNVAITRSREQMILVGDNQLLMQSPTYKPFIQYLREKGCCYGDTLE